MEAGAAEEVVDAILGFVEDGAEGAGTELPVGDDAVGIAGDAALEGEGFFDAVEDLEEADVGWRFGEAEAAAGAAMGFDEAAFGEGLEDFGEEAFWNAFLFADFVHHDGASLGLACKV